jgi:hypothetical protein
VGSASSRFESLDAAELNSRKRELAPTKRIGAKPAETPAAPLWRYSPIVYIVAGIVVVLLIVGAFVAGRMMR